MFVCVCVCMRACMCVCVHMCLSRDTGGVITRHVFIMRVRVTINKITHIFAEQRKCHKVIRTI